MLAAATTPVTVLSPRPLSHLGPSVVGYPPQSETQVNFNLTSPHPPPSTPPLPVFFRVGCPLGPVGQALCHTLGSHQTLVEMEGSGTYILVC